MYHALTPTPTKATAPLSVTPKNFTAQMALLKNKGFTPITTTSLAEAWRKGDHLPPRPILLTFDDGYEGVHRHALPTLTHHNFPATVFVSTGWLPGEHETGGALDTMLTWDQVRELAAAGLEIGAHSHTHPQLDQLQDTPLTHEITLSRDVIAAETGTRPASFAYPYGYSSRRVRQAVREAGFTQSLAVNNTLAHRSQSPYALTRLTVRHSTDLTEFERLIEGRALATNFARDHVLTRGYAVIRRTRRTLTALTEPTAPRVERNAQKDRTRGSRNT
ncbi:polysaccharide deacetylase family protein [Streptomyces iconiensis]|uniref:Polysaccharide deacetylase family protein n=1 Tax=Streptomyces iconiensis TaxID=1384038 RepID=A0ABT7A952_9ACTN|nr:polysaccharide deacetylase family protein [Streptomyces iconiensis]MDJ1137883.1 polysaccharide deacetylase family protein [Streptomyces iconiensis]